MKDKYSNIIKRELVNYFNGREAKINHLGDGNAITSYDICKPIIAKLNTGNMSKKELFIVVNRYFQNRIITKLFQLINPKYKKGGIVGLAYYDIIIKNRAVSAFFFPSSMKEIMKSQSMLNRKGASYVKSGEKKAIEQKNMLLRIGKDDSK